MRSSTSDIETGDDVAYNPLPGGDAKQMQQVVANSQGATNPDNSQAKKCDRKGYICLAGFVTIVGGVILAGLYGSRCPNGPQLDLGTDGLKYNITGRGWNSDKNPLTYFDHFSYDVTSLDTGATWHDFRMTVYDTNGTVIVDNERGSCIGSGHCTALDEYGQATTDSKLTYNHVVYDEHYDDEHNPIWRECSRSVQVKGYISSVSSMFALGNDKKPQEVSNDSQKDFAPSLN